MHNDTSTVEKTIPTNLRLLLLLEELAKAGVAITPTAVNEVLGLPKPTIHRLFHTLEEEGFLQRDIDGRSYAPGYRLRRFAASILSTSRIRMVRQTVLTALADDVGETCNIAMPERHAMVYLDRVETKWPLRIQLPVGTEVPFHCTASGKMYLSSLKPRLFAKYLGIVTLDAQTDHTITDPDALKTEIEMIRERGYSCDNEEFMEGMVAVAVPLLDAQNRLMSTLSIHAPTQRIDLDGLKAHLPRLKASALELAELVLH
ncbi:IclR family transcriptional regulator [Sulfitobacter guttiformis]|uniref:IclR family transcriptional regulator n=1 Tax=Sulfitobacter guttiformis TaxID=74349 RepID=A0A420DRT1_9RHOB|nr:IclR family transcriptional regulator [Sulfitobacter guttiformis]KIN74278.1 Transcriptional regulator, IclR family [Sulfitobacter guttiformis KCTC 32187]RKE96880.1 IclR family transcriptional regulator [Sulfitobacter guttiformis]